MFVQRSPTGALRLTVVPNGPRVGTVRRAARWAPRFNETVATFHGSSEIGSHRRAATFSSGLWTDRRPSSGAAIDCVSGSGGIRSAQTTAYLLRSQREQISLTRHANRLGNTDPEGIQDGSRRSSRSGAPPECEYPSRGSSPEGITDGAGSCRGRRTFFIPRWHLSFVDGIREVNLIGLTEGRKSFFKSFNSIVRQFHSCRLVRRSPGFFG
ncbi:hypothetical protein Poly24_23460 [Rosistilla carotiformis]|uniref:Uncharacterized protein n=1 Tax=Rosistilla carotiformis TaxID=2528017 RepID=A0A518JSW0_9BACT|nr:hypothetical protein Poly24_23460 [Rosistilla carotiformis]